MLGPESGDSARACAAPRTLCPAPRTLHPAGGGTLADCPAGCQPGPPGLPRRPPEARPPFHLDAGRGRGVRLVLDVSMASAAPRRVSPPGGLPRDGDQWGGPEGHKALSCRLETPPRGVNLTSEAPEPYNEGPGTDPYTPGPSRRGNHRSRGSAGLHTGQVTGSIYGDDMCAAVSHT